MLPDIQRCGLCSGKTHCGPSTQSGQGDCIPGAASAVAALYNSWLFTLSFIYSDTFKYHCVMCCAHIYNGHFLSFGQFAPVTAAYTQVASCFIAAQTKCPTNHEWHANWRSLISAFVQSTANSHCDRHQFGTSPVNNSLFFIKLREAKLPSFMAIRGIMNKMAKGDKYLQSDKLLEQEKRGCTWTCAS